AHAAHIAARLEILLGLAVAFLGRAPSPSPRLASRAGLLDLRSKPPDRSHMHGYLLPASSVFPRRASANSSDVNPCEVARDRNWSTSRSRALRRSAVFFSAFLWATNVPVPCWVSTIPRISISRYARAIVLRFTDRSTASWRTVGSWIPGFRRPSATARRP